MPQTVCDHWIRETNDDLRGSRANFYRCWSHPRHAQILLDVTDHSDDTKKRFLFSGDIGRGNNEVLRDPVAVSDVDFLLMECTYGGREHEMPAGFDGKLAEVLRAAIKRGGKILIPAFAVERTQQLLICLHDLFSNEEIPHIPVYVDSPLAVSATEIYRLHPESFNEEVYKTLFEKQNPFGFENLSLIRSVKGSRELNDLEGVAIIISASGMCEAGRILHHLRQHISDPRTTLLFVGYCAERTLGRKIRDGAKQVNILGDSFHVNAHIETIDSFSGHADHSELIDYFHQISGSKKQTWLIHGEVKSAHALQAALQAQGHSVHIGELGKEIEF